MPSPFVPQTVTITDYFTDGAGAPLDGRAEFRPSMTAKTTGGTITRNPVVAKITGGNLTVVLIAPDSTGVTPQNWTYEVTLILGPPGSAGSLGIDAWSHEVWNIRPVAANPAVVLRDLTEVSPVGDSQYEVKSVAGILPGLDGNVALTADDLDAGGVGYATQAALDAVDGRVEALEDGLSNVDNTSDVNKPVSTAQQAALDLKIPLTQKGAASGVATLDGSTQVPIAQLPTGTTASTVTIGNDARLSDARTPVAHAHPISDVTGLLTRLDDDTVGTTDLANLGDLAYSIPRYAASSQDTLSNQFLTIHGLVSMRSSFVATKLRLHVRTVVGSPGIMTLALFKGTNRLSLAKIAGDSVVTASFGTTGLKEFSFTGTTINRGDFVYLALLHTNAGTDPAVSTLPGPPSADFLNPTAAQTISGYKSGQTSIPATLDVSASFTANGRLGWFALAA